jgi:hypothetical protein
VLGDSRGYGRLGRYLVANTMTVGELIIALQAYAPEIPVKVERPEFADDYGFTHRGDIQTIAAYTGDDLGVAEMQVVLVQR